LLLGDVTDVVTGFAASATEMTFRGLPGFFLTGIGSGTAALLLGDATDVATGFAASATEMTFRGLPGFFLIGIGSGDAGFTL
jgi:hypothetical protein